MKKKQLDKAASQKKLSSPDLIGEWDHRQTTLLKEVLKTQEIRQALAMAIPEVLKLWASKGVEAPRGFGAKIKLKIAKMIGNTLKKGFLPKGEPESAEHIASLLKKPEINKIIQELFSEALDGTSGQLGGLIIHLAQSVNKSHEADPEFITKSLEPGINQWIESMDFGELKEAFEKSAKDGRSLVEMINNAIWKYPSKMVVILSFLPSFVNMVTCTLGISIERLNQMAPDLLTDIVLAYIKEINTDSMSGLINELTEILRKVHTGSALLGEPGTPQLPKVVGSLIEEIVDSLNSEVMYKAKIGLAEIKADLDLAHIQAAKNRNSQLNSVKKAELKNIRMRTFNRKASLLEAMDDSELADDFEKHITAYDIQEMAEGVNNTLSLFNRLRETKPELFTSVIRQFTDSVDSYELSETAKWVVEDAGTEMKPLARSVVPGLVTWTCDILKPVDDEFEEDATNARAALQSLFMTDNVEV